MSDAARRPMPDLPAGLFGDGAWVPVEVARALAGYREGIAAGRPDDELADLAWEAAVEARERAVELVETGGRVKIRRGTAWFDDRLKAGEAAALWFMGGELMGLSRGHDARRSS